MRSARTVIQARKDLADQPEAYWLASTKLTGVLHLFFYSVVVLLIDFCVNRTAGDEEVRKAEIREACKTLDEAREQSVPAGLFLDSLMAIMNKHRIRLAGLDGAGVDVPSTVTPPVATASAAAHGELPSEYVPNLDFDEIWQSYVGLEDLDPTGWDALMQDLDFS